MKGAVIVVGVAVLLIDTLAATSRADLLAIGLILAGGLFPTAPSKD